MKKDKTFSPSTDIEILERAIQYLSILLLDLPSERLKDSCVGARVLLFNLYYYLHNHHLSDYGIKRK